MASGPTHSDSSSNCARRVCGNGKLKCALALLVLILASCQDPFSIEELVDGPDGKALTVSPTSAVLQINDSLPIATSGGIPPYSYRVISGSGGFSGSLYAAPATPGSERIRVTDSVGTSREASFTIIKRRRTQPGDHPEDPDRLYRRHYRLQPHRRRRGPTSTPWIPTAPGATLVGNSYTAGSQPGIDIDEVTVTDGTSDTATAIITVIAKPFSIESRPGYCLCESALEFQRRRRRRPLHL